MCCGYFPVYLEDMMRNLFQLRCFGKSESVEADENLRYGDRGISGDLSAELISHNSKGQVQPSIRLPELAHFQKNATKAETFTDHRDEWQECIDEDERPYLCNIRTNENVHVWTGSIKVYEHNFKLQLLCAG